MISKLKYRLLYPSLKGVTAKRNTEPPVIGILLLIFNDYSTLFEDITFYKQKVLKKLQNWNYFCLGEYQKFKKRVFKFQNENNFAFYGKKMTYVIGIIDKTKNKDKCKETQNIQKILYSGWKKNE